MRNYLILLFVSVVLFSCRTDFDVNAPYSPTPVVYGILDQSVDTQLIRINKTFLGNNNTASAGIVDSSLFKNLTARVEQYTNGSIGNVYNLEEKWVYNIDAGLFDTDSQKVYYFIEPNLDKNSTYKLIGDGDGKSFTAETNMIGNYVYTNSTLLTTFNGISFSLGNGSYAGFDAKWDQAENAARYDLSVRMVYEEYTGSGSSLKTIDWFVGALSQFDIVSNSLSKRLEGENFYNYLASQTSLTNTAGITKRVIRNMEIRVTAANEILNTYIDINQPVTTIITERPEYTNVTGGVGIFASRQVLQLENLNLNKNSIEELAEGTITTNLLFCTDSVDYTSESYYCP